MSGGINPAYAREPASIPSHHDLDRYILREICRSRDDVSRSQADVDQQKPPHEGLKPNDQLTPDIGEPISVEQEDDVCQAEVDRVEEQSLDVPEPFAEPPHQVAPEEEPFDQTYVGQLLEEFNDHLGVEP